MKPILKGVLRFLVFDVLETIIISLAIFAFIYYFIASPHIIVGSSMNKSFADGEFLLVNKIDYRLASPQRGDVIVFHYDTTHDYIKRILGLPGDSISVNNGTLYVNGKQVIENIYVTNGNLTYGLDFLHNGETIVVPSHHYFVLGDNREQSSDSREWGFVNIEAIVGKAFLIYWPLQQVEIVPSIQYTVHGGTLVASTH